MIGASGLSPIDELAAKLRLVAAVDALLDHLSRLHTPGPSWALRTWRHNRAWLLAARAAHEAFALRPELREEP